MSENRIIVAIDGYSSCGKSTMAKELARYAGYSYVDTGAMYRALAFYAKRAGVMDDNGVDEARLKELLPDVDVWFERVGDVQHTIINGEDVEANIRTLEIGNYASRISTIGFVRAALVAMQQRMGDRKGIVMDGRDIGTVVFPNAELKVFVTATAEVRAERRYKELVEKNQEEPYEQVLENIRERDYRDTHRQESPLRCADDARVLDNSNLTKEQQMDVLFGWFNEVVNR